MINCVSTKKNVLTKKVTKLSKNINSINLFKIAFDSCEQSNQAINYKFLPQIHII
jgi:hypothetical protein